MTTAAHVCVQSIHSCLFAILWNIASQLQARILEWFAMPSFRESSWPRDWIRVSCGSWIAGVFFTAETSGKPLMTIQFSSVQSLNCHPTLCDPMDCSTPGFPVNHQLPEPTQTHVHQVSEVIPFFSCLQSFPASESFQMSQYFTSGGQSIGVSSSASVLPMNIQDWLPLGWTDWISLQSKGLSRVFSNTTVQKHQFFDAQPSL